MVEWWQNLTALQQVFITFAIPATLVLVVQFIVLLFGFGHDGGDVDVSGDANIDTGDVIGADGANVSDGAHDGLAMFSIRDIMAFFAVGGWSGVVAVDLGLKGNPAWPILISVGAGLLALFGMMYLYKLIMKLQSTGNLNIRNAIGKTGKVYLPIPAKKSRKRKSNHHHSGTVYRIRSHDRGRKPDFHRELGSCDRRNRGYFTGGRNRIDNRNLVILVIY